MIDSLSEKSSTVEKLVEREKRIENVRNKELKNLKTEFSEILNWLYVLYDSRF
jgi:hypothetical protein